MSDMKCPFCQQKLGIGSIDRKWLVCFNCHITGDDKLWQEIIRTRKALEIAIDTLKYANKCIKGGCVDWETEIDRALNKITALEQKDI